MPPENEGRPLRAVVVDPAAFSLPYDHSLCEALHAAEVRVALAYGAREDGPTARGAYERWNNFCPLTTRRKWLRPPGIAGKAIKSVDYAVSMRRFVQRLRAAPPDVVHFQWLPLPAVDMRAVRALRGVAPLVLTLHNTTVFHGAPTSRLQGMGFDAAVRLFDFLIVHTEYSRRRVLEHGWADEARVTVIPHGVLDYYRGAGDPAATPVPSRDGDLSLLFFGSLKPYKGIDVLVDAMGRLPDEARRRVRLVVAGSPGMDVAPLRAAAASGGVADRIEWRLGHVAEDEVGALFRRADAVVLPYREIDQSGVLLTAIAMRRPIVASNVGGIPETVRDGEQALLVPPGDPEALARAITRLVTDDALRARHEAALDRLAEGPLAWATIAGRTAALYAALARGA